MMLRMLARIATLAIGGAMLWAAFTVAAQDVTINMGLGTPPLSPVVLSPPQLVAIPGSPVYYAPEVTTNLFFYKGRYYTIANNVWSSAPAYEGPWVLVQVGKVPPPVQIIPVEYYKIPPGHLKKKGPPPWAGHGHGPKKQNDK